MKISKIECFPLSLVYPPPRKRTGNIVLIKIHTDEGIVGVAECGDLINTSYDQDIMMFMIKSWEPILIGANPFDKELILAKINHFINNVTGGLSFPNVVALIDFALWDLVGKALNQPIYQLLGGKACEKLAVDYVIGDVANLSPVEIAKKVEKILDNGIRTVCLKVGGFWGSDFERDILNVKTVRKAIGDREDVNLCIDANGAMDYTKSLELV